MTVYSNSTLSRNLEKTLGIFLKHSVFTTAVNVQLTYLKIDSFISETSKVPFLRIGVRPGFLFFEAKRIV